jgi:molybdopterin synthase sulfur carrier subunit
VSGGGAGAVTVNIAQPLRSYTRAARVEAAGRSLAELLDDLDHHYPGIRFRVVDEQDRVRQHIKFFVNREQVGALDAPLGPGDEVHIMQALSGG